MSNRLAGSSSPYLLQHQNNPVDWYPWGDEALDKAKAEDKPIFLSIGYSACHWCHVMEHESFENEAIAQIMNEHFVSIKVDREQRPDLDQIYMQAVQMMTGSGGWPMSVFLTPEGKPFYGGTYWPPENKFGRPGFPQVLRSVADAWKNRRQDLEQQGDELVGYIRDSLSGEAESQLASDASAQPWTRENLKIADNQLQSSFEPRHGGFGGAPKFPHATDLLLLLRLQAVEPKDKRLHVINHTLTSMANGGIYDLLGGGFARYSVDNEWLAPHFEKMLYDNALLAVTYLEAYQLTDDALYQKTVIETLDYLLRDMRNPKGGFHSAEDADSEGVEGKFYVWSREEIFNALPQRDAEFFCEAYDVTFGGNFEGHNILRRHVSFEKLSEQQSVPLAELQASLERSRASLFQLRSKRVRPGLDDKALTSWNALVISAMAEAGAVLNRPDYVQAATQCADFIFSELISDTGRLLHVWRDGKSEILAFLDDYAYLLDALVTLVEATGEPKHLERAVQIATEMQKHFGDPTTGAYFFTADDAETLIARSREWTDHSIPSSNGMAATGLIRLGILLGDETWSDAGTRILNFFRNSMTRASMAAGQLWVAADLASQPHSRWLLIVDDATPPSLIQQFTQTYQPHVAKLTVNHNVWTDGASSQATQAIRSLLPTNPETPSLIVCHGTVCQAPMNGVSSIESFLKELTTTLPQNSSPEVNFRR